MRCCYLAAGLVGACGSDSKKKHPFGDASAAAGSESGGGAGARMRRLNQPDEILLGPGDGGVWAASCGPNC